MEEQQTQLIPDTAVERGSGVRVVKGGYRQIGASLELPTVSGTRENEKQDGMSEENMALTIIDTSIDDEGVLVRGEAQVVASRPAAMGGWETSTGRQTKATLTPAPLTEPAVIPDTSAPVPPTETVGSPAETPAVPPAADPVCIGLTHEGGLSFVMDWDEFIAPEEDAEVGTVALARHPNRGVLAIPKGHYTLRYITADSGPHGLFTLNVYFGGQSFQSGLKYYIFVAGKDG